MRILAAAIPALSVSVLVAGCSDPIGPQQELADPPPISLLYLGPEIRRNGALLIGAEPVATNFLLPKNRYLTAVVTTSRGDIEAVILRHQMCGSRTCRRIIVWMSDGHSAAEIEPVVRLPEARVARRDTRSALVWAFGNRHQVLAHIASQPGVGVAEFDGMLSPDPDATFDHYLAGAIPFDHGAIMPGDGFLTIEDGDSVEVAYTDRYGVQTTYSVTLGILAP